MRFKDVFVWLLVFVVGSLIVSFLIYPDSFQSFKSNIASKINGNIISSSFSGSPSIKELSQNPDNYYGKNISVSGKLKIVLLGYNLRDSNGYLIFIEDKCVEEQRAYDYNTPDNIDSKVYTAKGIWVAPTSNERDWNAKDKPHLECSVPLI